MRLRQRNEKSALRIGKGLLILLLGGSALPLAAQKIPVDPNAIRNQLNQPASPAPAAPAKAQAPVKPQTAVKPQASAKAQATPQPASSGVAKAASVKDAAKAPVAAKAAETESASLAPNLSRRDPFDPLIGKTKENGVGTENLPPGKAGLMIATLRVDGVIRSTEGMIAVVSNAQQHTYFVHQGDQLYDGQVAGITMEAVSFHQNGKDPFGTPIERDVTKQLYPTPGEQP